MGKAIKRIRVGSFITILLELILIATFCTLYFNNVFHLKEYIAVEYIIVGAAAIVFLNCLFVWIVVILISRLRQQTDLHAAEVIGSDVQEAYNFAMIGLVVTDNKDMVLWTNDLFKDRHIDIIDSNILVWQPDLAELKESAGNDKTTKVVINSRNYEVKFLLEAGLWIFKDITDYESIYKYSKEQAPVIGILSLDNYQDVVHGEDDFNDTVTKVKNVIFNYAKEYGVLLRKIKDDSYSMLCNYESFAKMKADNFYIVDKVREIGAGTDIPLTISIGLAHEFPDVIKLNELANEALDIAMSRGGDQVVISAYGSDMEFIGGKTEAQEKRNRVKVRVLADSLIGLIKTSSRILIMGHRDMDMDALGACLGIKAICSRLSKPSKIVVDLKLTEFKTRAAITSNFSKDEIGEIMISPKEAAEQISPDTLLVVCDVHIPSMVMAPNLLEKASKIVVIDHHRRAEEYIDSPVFNHIDPSASSSCELIAELIRYASINPRIELPQIFATIMLSGIFLDSSYFKSKHTGLRTFEACTILKDYGADNSLADDLLKDDFEEYVTINELVRTMQTPAYGVVYAIGPENRIYDSATLAKAANLCLTMKGNHAAFVIGKTSNKDVRISCRSDGSINVQLLAEKLGGGGHFTSAAVSIEKADLETVKNSLLNVLETSLNMARADAKTRSKLEED